MAKKMSCFVLLVWSLGSFAHKVDCEQNLLAKLKTISVETSLKDSWDVRGRVVRYLSEKSSSDRRSLEKWLASRHADREMSFQVKNEATGHYDKFVAVPVNGFVFPMLRSDFDRLIQSTGPLMRLYRRMLQKIYSGHASDPKELNLEILPPKERELALYTIQQSIYFEPALVHPNMADYPFLTVAGFDGAIVDPKNPEELFFETNLGTPSGLSNNIQLLEDLLWLDDGFKQIVEPYRAKDDTFERLRRAIESNARYWTGRDGLSVVISPGIYNGAHPDVASIARAAGMPLVRSSDLYQDREGWIRLNTGSDTEHPIVTGIYGRMEESFFLQNQKDGIPLISPQFQDQTDLSKKLGVNLRPGAIYDFIYNEKGDITGVNKDENGQPLFAAVWDSMSDDPSGKAGQGSFARAIVNRKLYYSGLGGRVVDDKRLFRILTTYFLNNVGARPIQGLAPDQLDLFFADPTRFVVKEPNNSGGSGIYFPRAMNPEDVTKLSRRVREHPSDFEIQYVSAITTLPQLGKSKSGAETQSDAPIDVRLFIMMNAEGDVDAGPNSMLLRTGASGGLYTNTSRGGGYGIGLVLEDRMPDAVAPTFDWAKLHSLPIAESRLHHLDAVLDLSQLNIQCLGRLRMNRKVEDWDRCRALAMDLSFAYREIMDLLEPLRISVIAKLRDFAQLRSHDAESSADLLGSLQIATGELQKIGHPRLQRLVKATLEVKEKKRLLTPLDPVDKQHLSLPTAARLRRLNPPEVTYRFFRYGRFNSQKVELAEYLWVDNPEVQAVINEVKAFGGEVRLLLKEEVTQNPHEQIVEYNREPAYFWLNLNPSSPSYLKPVIALDLASEMALAALYHEREHFRLFRELYANYRRRGFGHEKAMKQAYAETNSERMIVEGERRAVRAEIRAETVHADHPYNRHHRDSWEPKEYFEVGYVNRMAYPEFEAIRAHLHRHRWSGGTLNEAFLADCFRQAIEVALSTRERAISYWKERDAKSADLKHWREANVFLMLTEPYGRERLDAAGLVGLFKVELSKVCAELGVSETDCGVPR